MLNLPEGASVINHSDAPMDQRREESKICFKSVLLYPTSNPYAQLF